MPLALNFDDFGKSQVDQKLRELSCEVMNSGYVCTIGNEIKQLALPRMINNIPPASKGKNAAKDCIIYEEVLHIAKLLREAGFDKRVVFASSNTKEYYDDSTKKLHQSIEEELSERSVTFTSSLNWAESEAKKYDL